MGDNERADVRWRCLPKWEAILLRATASILISASVACAVVTALRLEWAVAALSTAAATFFFLRVGRGLTIAIAVLPEEILVRRALSVASERFPADKIAACVLEREPSSGSERVVLQQRKWWWPPVVVVRSRRPSVGYSDEEWNALVADLQSMFGPTGKWRVKRWWPLVPPQ